MNHWGSSVWFGCKTSTADQIFYIHYILETNWEYNETVHQLFRDLKKAYDSVRREVLIVQYSHKVWSTDEISQAD
jgi:hypothetical protein